MNSKVPRVSIGMPVFNDLPFIEKALISILRQTWQDFELIISDDGSSDGSMDVCLRYAALDPRIRFIRQPENLGISRNMRFLYDQAKGYYFMWAADDDLWAPDFIETLVHALENHPDCISAFCPVVFINEQDQPYTYPPPRKTDYSGPTPLSRIRKLALKFDDCFGYGLFVREKISRVRFPVWWWVNRRCAYNNIYPSLYYYLASGNFILVDGPARWFNRLKDADKINHKVPFPKYFIRGYLAFMLRSFNLAFESLRSISMAPSGWKTAIQSCPYLFLRMALDLRSEFLRQYFQWRSGNMQFW